ncbi:hypothetical protein JCM10450v2_006358 [Rhodotorula kratochvilovae]
MAPFATSPSLASPVKRSYRASPTSSPDPSKDAPGELASPRVLRTKLSTVADEVTLELPFLPSREICRAEDAAHADEEDTTPSTPPEVAPEPLVGLGVAGADEAANEAVKDTAGETEGGAAGATQTRAAERQMRELEGMPQDVHVALARLCSQHWSSQYNSLKRSLAAAAGDATQGGPFRPLGAQAPAPPPAYALPAFAPSPSTSRMPTPLPASQSSGATSTPRSSPPRSITPASIAFPSTPVSAPTAAPAPTSLTPSLASFSFNFPSAPALPAPKPSLTPADEVNGLLADLVNGEPVSVQQRGSSVVVSETVPRLARTPAPDAPPVEPQMEAIPGLLPGMKVVNGVAVKTSISHPINISPLVPPELLEYLSSHLSAPSATAGPAYLHPDDPFVLRSSASTDLLSVTMAYAAAPSSLPTVDVAPPALGNFVLSSCPGKKVRMNGEPKQGGRGAICRDVLLDLRRARDEFNVRLVVCCLDDAELAYLGVPWLEYAATLTDLGLDVVRLPMVEGFAPASVHELDAHVARIVREYTLRGRSVLAHCRGGIGRAGLVASCWMLKMGLVAASPVLAGEGGGAPWGAEDPMRIVERVVELIRRRRSIKAIETPHQVHFLLQYITYLQQHAHIVTAGDIAPFSA